jgi:hypothetical protein
MAEETQYTAKTGQVTISSANTRRDGTGTMGDVITGAANGTLIKSVFIKAQTNTTEGMIRLFVYTGASNPVLIGEIPVSNITKSSRDKSFETYLELDLFLQSGDTLKASTENAETFNVIAIGLDVAYDTTASRLDSTLFMAQTGFSGIALANPNLNGTGFMSQILLTNSTPYNGAQIKRIFLKANASTTPGMVRLFIRNTAETLNTLFTEIPVPAVTPTATAETFEYVLEFNNLFLQTEYSILASTENAELFVVTAEAMNFKYSS